MNSNPLNDPARGATPRTNADKMSFPANKKPFLILVHPVLGFWDYMRSGPSLPLNLLHAASRLCPEFDTRIIDLRTGDAGPLKIDALLKEKPVLVGITCMVGPSTVSAMDVARRVKSASSTPVVLGGVHPSLTAGSALKEPDVDYVIMGEGEISLLELARRLSCGGAVAGIPGVRGKPENADTGAAINIPNNLNLEDTPEIPYSTVDLQRYIQIYNGASYLPMETSRGCRCGCSYCYNSITGYGEWRAQSADRVLSRAKHLKELSGAQGIYFVDDNFFVDIGRGMQIAAGMKRLNLKWQVQGIDIGTVKKMPDAHLRELSRSGLTRITIGVESGSDRIRALLRKQLKSSEVLDAIRRLRQVPFIVYCSFISDIPGETLPDIKDTTRLIAALANANPHFRTSPVYRFIPFPGTLLHSIAMEHGFEPPAGFRDWGNVSYENGCGGARTVTPPEFHNALYFVTLFCDKKYVEYLVSPVYRLLSAMYRPFAMFRLKHFLFSPIPEMKLFHALQKLLFKMRSRHSVNG